MRLATALAATLVSFPAMASGGLWCAADDGRVKIDVSSSVSRSGGSDALGFGARLRIADQAVSQDLREVAIPSQYWFDGDTLNLLLYEEREPVALRDSVRLKITTSLTEDDQILEGEYEVDVDDVPAFDPDGGRHYAGSITCSFD